MTVVLGVLWVVLKIVAVLLLVAWITFTQWSFRKTKGLKEKKSMQRWFAMVASLGIFGVLTQWIMFSLAWLFRWNKNRYFSWWLDDSRFGNYKGSPWAKDYYIYLNGRAETFWIAYLWHMRNMIWNLQSKFRVLPQKIKIGNQNIYITHLIKDTIRKVDDTKLDIDGIYGQFAGLKYWKNGVSTWDTMNGEQLSIQKSIIGTGFYFYMNSGLTIKEKNQLNWSYTSCTYIKKGPLKGYWMTIQIGSKQKGYSRQFKFQKDIEWK